MWRKWWPYKAFAFVLVSMIAGANCLMKFDTVADFMASPGLEYTHGVRAAVFALIAAAALSINLLPKDNVEQDSRVAFLSKTLSIITAFLAGLFWLLDETKGNAVPYVVVVLVVTGTLMGFLAIVFLIQLSTDWIRQRGNRPQSLK